MAGQLFVGIDTSNYTTSIAAVNDHGTVVGDYRQPLEVKENQRGLRQSEAFFQHVQNLPNLTERLFKDNSGSTVAGICVSSRPRPRPDSYMPVFLPGLSLARSLAAALGIPCSETSHQENHIWAGIGGSSELEEDTFLALHVSGGTTDLLLVRRRMGELGIQEIGTSSDLNAGQFVDRVGVALGLPFPAGPHLEGLAENAEVDLGFACSQQGGCMSFSGPESAAQRMVGRAEPADIAFSVFSCIARTLERALAWAAESTECGSVLLAGGVMANQKIAVHLREHLCGRLTLHFADPAMSVDNAVGAALQGLYRCTWPDDVEGGEVSYES